ncbi:MAG: histidine phosphatase family protein [Chitinophagaceae bacterium]|nr:MAG: histidine phosphatase family protein [Chitinophagaceae bacterium]
MKQLLIVRHAKSSWENFAVPDFERPLNDRGKKDAPMMAERLVRSGISPDLLVTSTAKRARKTAEFFARAFKLNDEQILEVPELYEASIETFFDVVSRTPGSASTVILFSHNPGITGFVNTLTNTRIDDMPTCAVFACSCDIDRWTDFRQALRGDAYYCRSAQAPNLARFDSPGSLP